SNACGIITPMNSPPTNAHVRSGVTLLWVAALFNLSLAAVQLALFLPAVTAGHALDIAAGNLSIYRVDGLGLVFGVAWCLGLALLALLVLFSHELGYGTKWTGAFLCLMTVGILSAIYAREPLWL